MELKQLVEQAQGLVDGLLQKGKEIDAFALELGKKEDALTARKVELDNLQAELLQREKNVQPYENVGEALAAAQKAQAEAELELSKARGEREKAEEASKALKIEMDAARSQLAEQKALYERGAKENLKKQEQLDKKLKALQGVNV
jgi:hypothetical protein